MTFDTTVLLVEDSPDDAQLTLRAFRQACTEPTIHVATNGEQALEWLTDRLETTHVLPAVVLLDLRMPKIDGFEVLRQIRADERMRLLPVMVLTSSTEDADLLKGYELGANSYVRKPVDFGQLLEVVRDIGRYWLGRNELPWALGTSRNRSPRPAAGADDIPAGPAERFL